MFGFCQNWIFGQRFDFQNSVFKSLSVTLKILEKKKKNLLIYFLKIKFKNTSTTVQDLKPDHDCISKRLRVIYSAWQQLFKCQILPSDELVGAKFLLWFHPLFSSSWTVSKCSIIINLDYNTFFILWFKRLGWSLNSSRVFFFSYWVFTAFGTSWWWFLVMTFEDSLSISLKFLG